MDTDREIFTLVWGDAIEMTVELHPSLKSALDSASKLRNSHIPFAHLTELIDYMERHMIAGGIFPRRIAK